MDAGFTEEQAKTAFENRIEFEKELLKRSEEAGKNMDSSAMLTMDQAEALAGEFPLRKLAETHGYAQASEYKVYQTDITAAAELYKKEHLNELKNYLICGYALQTANWLDEKTFKLWMTYNTACDNVRYLANPDLNPTIEDRAANLVVEVIPTPAGKAYKEAYDLEPVKEFAVSFTKDVIETYKQIINSCEWLSDASKKAILRINVGNICQCPENWTAILEISSSM